MYILERMIIVNALTIPCQELQFPIKPLPGPSLRFSIPHVAKTPLSLISLLLPFTMVNIILLFYICLNLSKKYLKALVSSLYV